MANNISAAANPAKANELLKKAQEIAVQEEPKYEPVLTPPSDTTVALPGGYITDTGEVLRTAEVRELNGLDEEAIARTNSLGKAIITIINRGTVSIGGEKATERLLDNLLAGDRDTLLLAIFKNTFGKTAEVGSFCVSCQEEKTVQVNIDEDIKTRVLLDPVNDRYFTVAGKSGEILVQLPTGFVQKELINNSDKTSAELSTMLLENCVVQIDGSPVISKVQVQTLGLADRHRVTSEINSRVPGPLFDDITVECPDCGGEVTVPINLGTLFRF